MNSAAAWAKARARPHHTSQPSVRPRVLARCVEKVISEAWVRRTRGFDTRRRSANPFAHLPDSPTAAPQPARNLPTGCGTRIELTGPICYSAALAGKPRMIPRYTRPDMAAIWEPQTRFRIWFEIEAHAADAMAELGSIPKAAAKTIWAKGKTATFDVARIDEIEREVKHDVIAFLTHLAEIVGPEARFVHAGMTSSDVLDTCFNVQLKRAADILVAD